MTDAPNANAPSAPPPIGAPPVDAAQVDAPGARRRRGFGVVFWLFIVFGLICVAAGVVIGRYGPTLFPIKPVAAPAAPAPAPAPTGPAPAAAALAAPAPPVPTPAFADSAGLAALSARVDRMETGQRRAVNAAAASLAAAALSQGAQTSRPFVDELSALDRLLPDSADVRALRALAETGAPTRAALAAEFGDVAARAAVAARAPAQGSEWLARVTQTLAAIFTIRRVDRTSGDSLDAVLARAERDIDDGDLEGGVAELDRLPAGARDAAAGWRAKAQRRIEIDRRVAGVRAAALHEILLTSDDRAAS
ncbi:hypothetical protein C5708_06435 [Caulobacter sp. CCUG 60055]|uniref:COG4223 family protein n=1 Tax=Caulobacter sp. CCUG 60055 TaxID=2100090 RepID=UPI001FA80B93|nr:mitofilin family membrane protein [Caulobacter sp. CCUG 60055]MBQ1543212.1 hypothetical protein [Caulobacteraceae bacterium]MCI3179890.1 hypothetical protein [Caulobacter sp. CCUG 60055]